jgi:hypothetical protein
MTPLRGRRHSAHLLKHGLQSRQAFADDPGTTYGLGSPFWGWRMEDRIQSACRDQRHLLSLPCSPSSRIV